MKRFWRVIWLESLLKSKTQKVITWKFVSTFVFFPPSGAMLYPLYIRIGSDLKFEIRVPIRSVHTCFSTKQKRKGNSVGLFQRRVILIHPLCVNGGNPWRESERFMEGDLLENRQLCVSLRSDRFLLSPIRFSCLQLVYYY